MVSKLDTLFYLGAAAGELKNHKFFNKHTIVGYLRIEGGDTFLMKVYFIRHGEAMDDVENRYGGWADYPLSPKGVEQARATGQKLKSRGVTAEVILTSPFKRAYQTAEELGKILNFPIETSVYLKERNTYGLLCGEKKDEAQEKYPELVAAYENDEPVLGYESYDFLLQRVRKLIELLPALGHETLILSLIHI